LKFIIKGKFMEKIMQGGNELPEEAPDEIPTMPQPEFPEPVDDPRPEEPFIPADQPDKKPEENV